MAPHHQSILGWHVGVESELEGGEIGGHNERQLCADDDQRTVIEQLLPVTSGDCMEQLCGNVFHAKRTRFASNRIGLTERLSCPFDLPESPTSVRRPGLHG